jgi:hypothetical protein
MALRDLSIDLDEAAVLPQAGRDFIAAGDANIEAWGTTFPSFIPCDHDAVYQALSVIRRELPGNRFCEWGAGIGVVAGLAAMLGYDSHAIEIEEELVSTGVELHHQFELQVDFAAGSFVPPESQDLVAGAGGELDWLQPGGDDAYDLLARDPDEFDLFYVYPWPGEESTVEELFDRHAARGAVLVSWHGIEGHRVRRAVD